jgi:hypothetical protein
MTAEQVLQLHSEGFKRALIEQDYNALEEILADFHCSSDVLWMDCTALLAVDGNESMEFGAVWINDH